ncbi:MAG: phage baseplate protein [Anaerolineae bacterium]|nr:phage baseplate protein [Anaerolineae bacterium]
MAAELLNVWEEGAGDPPYLRALRLLAAALPDRTATNLAAWSLGRRDSALLSLREQLFGSRLSAVADCPTCSARLEFDFDTVDIRAPYADEHNEPLPPLHSQAADHLTYTIRFRPLTTGDLIDAVADPGRSALIARCVIEACREDESIPPNELPAEVLADCARALAACDPQADVLIALTCPDCGRHWEAPFDIGAYLWHELEGWARRTLREIHVLASVYGWTEPEILALSAARRRIYLDMVTQ